MSNLDLRRFDKTVFAEKAKKMDYIDLVLDVEKQLENLGHIRMPKDNDKYTVKEFLSFLITLRNALEMGLSTVSHDYQVDEIKPILQALIDKGQLLPSILGKLI